MNRATFVNECAPRGIERVLRSAAWSGIIRRDLRAGHPLLISRLDDAHCVEPVIVRYRDNRLGCELVSCEADGTPLLASVEPVFRDVILLGLVIPNQGFQLDANTLLDRLGRNDRVTIGSPKQSEDATSLHFLFTRWQARVLRRLRLLLHTHRPSPPVGAVSAS